MANYVCMYLCMLLPMQCESVADCTIGFDASCLKSGFLDLLTTPGGNLDFSDLCTSSDNGETESDSTRISSIEVEIADPVF